MVGDWSFGMQNGNAGFSADGRYDNVGSCLQLTYLIRGGGWLRVNELLPLCVSEACTTKQPLIMLPYMIEYCFAVIQRSDYKVR